jgi:opacity protein-like surface antigen
MRRQIAVAAVVGAAVLLMTVASPRFTSAQSIGVGARMAIVKGGDSPLLSDTGEDRARFTGALARVKVGRLAVEGSVDQHTFEDDTTGATIKCYPIQASLIYYFSKTKRGLYVLGGAGYYLQKLSLTDDNDELVTSTAHSIGYHLGVGLELELSQHLTAFTDYRYTFADAPTFGGITSSVLSSVGLHGDAEGLNTKGSMWVTGVMIYF